MFKIDFKLLVRMLTPTVLRQPYLLAWQTALVTPVENLYERFKERREQDLFRESIDPTVPRLEFMLNTIFYPPGLEEEYENRIRIQTQHSKIPLGIYLGGITQPKNEHRPVYLVKGEEPVYLYTKAETLPLQEDFQIIIPMEAQPYDLERLRSLIRAFALPDKQYVIINL